MEDKTVAETLAQTKVLILNEAKELEANSIRHSEKARNQAIGVFAFIALVLSIIGAFGVPMLIQKYATEAAEQAIESEVNSKYVESVKKELQTAKLLREGIESEFSQIKTINTEAIALRNSISPKFDERITIFQSDLSGLFQSISGLKQSLNNIEVGSCKYIMGACGKGMYQQPTYYLDRVGFECPDSNPILRGIRFERCGGLNTVNEGLLLRGSCCQLKK